MKKRLIGALVLLSSAGAAQQPLAPDTATTPPNPLALYGAVDAYYGFDFNRAPGQDRPAFLYSHNRQNEFAINHAVAGLRYQDERVRGAVGLQAGTYVSANYAAEDPAVRLLYEAYAGFRPFRRAWLDAGIFASHIGFESAISQENWTLSPSLMAENSPYYEAGVRLAYEISPRLTVTGLVLNGWQNIRETNQGKALGTQVQWTPAPRWRLNSSTFVGNEAPVDAPTRRRYFHDFHARYSPTDQLSLALVFDVGWQQCAVGRGDVWHTGALLGRYAFTKAWAFAARAEYYQAERGVIINAALPAGSAPVAALVGASLNLDYAPTPRVLARVEGRILRAEALVFPQHSGPGRNYPNLTSSLAFSF
ncbi:porin [Hymenobacter sp. BT175]|uniref:porin n=1 Tax=Hymenobacter translucens TaxID=2886507 RepID=UPI001D0DDC47|nr:porin [Hymenobacter translucens]MCC2548611.1 porin [Hymenobacter translucens]